MTRNQYAVFFSSFFLTMINNCSSEVHHIIVNLSITGSFLEMDLFKHAQQRYTRNAELEDKV